MDMREKIARAIWRETYRNDTLLEWHEIKRGTMHHKRTLACVAAVLVALNEPTDEMIHAGVGRQINHDWNNALPSDLSQMRDCWYNMIHAAAKEKETA